MRSKFSFVGFIVVALNSVAGYSQVIETTVHSAPNGNVRRTIIQQKPGVVTTVLIFRSDTVQVNQIDMTKQVNIIVEFKGEPLFLQQMRNHSRLPQVSSYQALQSQFMYDLAALHQSAVKGLKVTLSAPAVTRQFSKVFYGAAVTVPRAMISQIAGLSYVKRVFMDRPVKALLERSVHQIRADSVWTKFKTKGQGVLVGIIDTGIDYDDSALGGGIGAGFKVVGGYNFIDNTSDPMDDNGHGTHVAGIIAANGDGLEGVAPDARLMVFKVLDQYGFGSESSVIAGIERAADPDNDGNDSDKVDIVNMSLGGPGGPNDALSAAMDSAAEIGITFCISAGNSANYYTIGSPGAASLAITVGAVDSLDNLASFSSRGPDSTTYSIKPDVLAPGVNISSTFPYNSVFTLSGTSMAAPFVSGVCALLKSLHKSWPPETIKSAIVTTAVNIGQDVMAQGGGRVDALNAAEVTTFAYPCELSFGLDSSTFSEWTVVDIMSIKNADSVSQSFALTFDNVPYGATLAAVPSAFTLPANDSQSVVVTLNVDNQLVPYPTFPSGAYAGYAYLDGTKDTLHIPWAFVKLPRVLFTFDRPDPTFFLTNTNYGFSNANATWNDLYDAELQIPNGNYDLATLFAGTTSDHLVVEEHVPIESASHVYVNSASATNPIVFDGLDVNWQPLDEYPSATRTLLLNFPDSSFYAGFSLYPPDTVYCSNFSNDIWLGDAEFANNANSIYSVQFDSIDGLGTGVTLNSVPSDFCTQNVHVDFPPYTEGMQKEMTCWNASFWTNPFDGFREIIGMSESNITSGFKGDWSGKLYITNDKTYTFTFPLSLMASDSTSADSTTFPVWLSTPFLRVTGDSIEYFVTGEPFPQILSPNGGYSSFGHSPFFMLDWFLNQDFTKPTISVSGACYGGFDEYLSGVTDSEHTTITDGRGNVIYSADLPWTTHQLTVAAGQYTSQQVTRGYYIRGLQGTATLACKFDFSRSDPNPPTFTSLRLLNSEGIAVDSLSKSENATITFSAWDDGPVVRQFGNLTYVKYGALENDSTRLFYRIDGSKDWVSIPVVKVSQDSTYETEYKADVTPTSQVDSTAIDLRIDVEDQAGNTSEWVMEPAYYIGNFGTATAIVSNPGTISVPKVLALYQNYPNPFNPSTIISYQLPMNGYVTLKIYDVLGREVRTLVDKVEQPGSYSVNFNAESLASGVYFYRLNAGGQMLVKKFLLLK